jgi:hypothetical protein
MIKVNEGFTYGSYHYEFTLTSENSNIPYQITFDRDLYFNRTNVTLLNLTTGDDNGFFSRDIRNTICGCFTSFFSKEPNENVYFELDLSHNRNIIKFYKFYRWGLLYPEYNYKIEITERQDILYAGITISKK